MGVVYTKWSTAPKGDFSALSKVQSLLEEKFDGTIDPKKLLEGAKSGMAAATGDQYTTYLNAEEAKQLTDDLNGKLSGIGAEIGLKDSMLIVVAPLPGSPAEAAGLRAGDVIAQIDGQDSAGLTVTQAVLKIRGEAETTVKLGIVRNSKPVIIKIKRQLIDVPSVKSSMKGKVGYIQISRFASDTGAKLAEAAEDLKAKGATGFLLDLRNDPGGYLDTAVDVASQFLAKGKVVVEEKRFGKTEKILKAEGGGKLTGVPVVVLINGGSASASEIVAGALQDQGRATVAGTDSFGKGSVQDLINLDGGAQLKVTIAHWFTPKGRSITKEGIKPDVKIEQPNDGNSLSDPQLEQALKLLK